MAVGASVHAPPECGPMYDAQVQEKVLESRAPAVFADGSLNRTGKFDCDVESGKGEDLSAHQMTDQGLQLHQVTPQDDKKVWSANCKALQQSHIAAASLVESQEENLVRIFFRPRTLAWSLLLCVQYAYFGFLAVRWFPHDGLIILNTLAFLSNIVYMDLVTNWLTGLLLHRVPCLRFVHRLEHSLTKGGELHHVLCITFFYGIYTLLHMYCVAMVVACSKQNCWHWVSTMWTALLGYSALGTLLRIWLWIARHRPVMYSRFPMLLKMAQFYWAHFNFHEWDRGVCFGAATIFWDVIFGTCPYDIKYSVPVPFVDFILHGSDAFMRVQEPERIRWSPMQRMWHSAWVISIIGVVVTLALLGLWE